MVPFLVSFLQPRSAGRARHRPWLGIGLVAFACSFPALVAGSEAGFAAAVPVDESPAAAVAGAGVTTEPGIWRAAGQDFRAIPLEFWSAFTGITVIGIRNWEWGSSSEFRFQDEGWFGMDTGSGGIDKLGHAFTAYGFTNTFADGLIHQGVNRKRAATSAAIWSQALMMYVEVFDGYSVDHGFAREDVVMNLSGTTLAWFRNAYPRVGALVDYRQEYYPSGYKGFNPVGDYAGMKYLFAFKLAGIESLQATPLRFFELQGGYYTRGFSQAEKDDGLVRTRHDFIGVGINLNEVLLGPRRVEQSFVRRTARSFLEHYQLPYTSATHSRAH